MVNIDPDGRYEKIRKLNDAEFNKKDIRRFDDKGNKINFRPQDGRSDAVIDLQAQAVRRFNRRYRFLDEEDKKELIRLTPEDIEVDGIDYGRELIALTCREGQDDVRARYKRYLKETPTEKEYLASFEIERFSDFKLSKWDCNNGCEIVNEFEGLEYGEWSWDNE
jgi:hypothetical protein